MRNTFCFRLSKTLKPIPYPFLRRDLATDCAAIVPAPLAPSSHVARPANRPAFSGPAHDSVISNPSNQGSFLGPRDTSSARVYDLEDRPPLSMDCAVYPQFSRHQERRATFSNWPLPTIFHPDDLVMQGFYYAGTGPSDLSMSRISAKQTIKASKLRRRENHVFSLPLFSLSIKLSVVFLFMKKNPLVHAD